jgi:heme exporter protein CcmC
MMAINAWVMMLVASLVWMIRRHHVSALAAKAAAPRGLTFTLIALVTGALWGQPMWGTWWEWDPRLTSFLILFLFYLGYIALWQAIENPDTAADLTGVLCLVGSVFAMLSRYAVNFWNQGLHQGASLSLDKEGTWPMCSGCRSGLHRGLRAAVRGAGAAAHPHRNPGPPDQGAGSARKAGLTCCPIWENTPTCRAGVLCGFAGAAGGAGGLTLWRGARVKAACAHRGPAGETGRWLRDAG